MCPNQRSDSETPGLLVSHPALASALVALALTGLLYGDTLALPLFSDDLVQIPWLKAISWRELWSSPSPYGYYRPLWYTLWRLWGAITGGLRPPGLHALNVIAHFAASWLVGQLAVAWMRPGLAVSRDSGGPTGLATNQERDSGGPLGIATNQERHSGGPPGLATNQERHSSGPTGLTTNEERHSGGPTGLATNQERHSGGPTGLATNQERHSGGPTCLTTNEERHAGGLTSNEGAEEGGDTTQAYIVACLASALFAAFPFSRQAVAWPGAVYNPVVSALAAGALLAYDRGRRDRNAGWIGLALAFAALAPFTYEAGLLVGPMVILVEGLGRLQRRWPRRSWWPLAFGGLVLLTLAIWRTMRGAGVTGFGLNPADLVRNASYVVQGLVYPTAPLAQRLTAWSGLNAQLSLWLIAAPTLALLVGSGLRWHGPWLRPPGVGCVRGLFHLAQSGRGMFWLGVIWLGLFAMPPVVSMEADWFALAPRFLYMTAAGSALIWTAAASTWIARVRAPRRGPAAGILLVALLAPAVAFVRDGVGLYAMAGESIWDAAQAARREQPVLLVNLPMRITPQERVYPLGFEGVTPLPMRVSAEGLVDVHTGIPDAAEAVAFGIVAAEEPLGYTVRLFGPSAGWEELASAIRRARAVYLAQYEPNRIYLAEAGGQVPSDHLPSGEQASPNAPKARFGDLVTLLDATCTCDERGQVHLSTYWQVEAPVKTDVTVFAHLLDSDDALIAQADGYPLMGMLPFWLWEPGEAVRDVRRFEPVPAGAYTVRLGMWELATGEHWLAGGTPDGTVRLAVRCP